MCLCDVPLIRGEGFLVFNKLFCICNTRFNIFLCQVWIVFKQRFEVKVIGKPF